MRLKQIGSAGYKTRRYHERPNETSNTEVKETMKVAITAKRVVILMMTMALAVAMVACSAAAGKPGPAGPKGDTGEPGEDAPVITPEPGTTPGGPVPVQMIRGIDDFIFSDAEGKMIEEPMSVPLAEHFYPPTNVMYAVDPSMHDEVGASVTEDGMLKVMLKSGAKYDNHMFKVKASNDISSVAIPFEVRRNRAPMVPMYKDAPADATAVVRAAISVVWVGTTKSKELKIGPVGADCMIADCIPIYLKGKPMEVVVVADATAHTRAFFNDDPGNELKLYSERLSATDGDKLDVMGGSKVTLMGKKSTGNVADESGDIMVYFRAMDDDGLESADRVHVFNVRVDEAPKVVGEIGTRLIRLTGTQTQTLNVREVIVTGTAGYFSDPDALGTGAAALTFEAKSDNPSVALIDMDGEGNETTLVGKNEFKAIIGSDLRIVGIDEGEAMITIKAKEGAKTGDEASTVDSQSTTLMFKVAVSLE